MAKEPHCQAIIDTKKPCTMLLLVGSIGILARLAVNIKCHKCSSPRDCCPRAQRVSFKLLIDKELQLTARGTYLQYTELDKYGSSE